MRINLQFHQINLKFMMIMRMNLLRKKKKNHKFPESLLISSEDL